ncbi:MAG: MBL fold metallo-hydrolase [Bacteroidales bacterium]|nr:MBL fold metallo-hydrolase [Bacteroidales bacterium]
MIKRVTLLIYLFLLVKTGTACGNDSVTITYIANCGYIIEMDNHKIIVDGLFKLGHNHYSVPDSATRKRIEFNQPPFNNISLILITYTHEDHFDSQMVTDYMLNNTSAGLVCPQQVKDRLSENMPAYDKIKTRIITCTPDTFTSQLIHVEGIEIHACRLAHPKERHKNVQNIAYLISVNGKSVFHSADADPSQVEKYTGIKLNEMDIDIGFINEDFSKIENAGITRDFINAGINISMHLPDSEAGFWLDSLKDQPDLFSHPFIFTKKMEQKVFYIE